MKRYAITSSDRVKAGWLPCKETTLAAATLRLQRNSSGCWISICVRISISLPKKSRITWSRRGQDHQISSNTGRQRINLNGAIDCAGLSQSFAIDTVHAQSTIALLQQIEQQHPAAARIYVICDNARYYRSQLVTEHLTLVKFKNRIDLPATLCTRSESDRALLAILQKRNSVWQVLSNFCLDQASLR
nr:transposase [Nitrosomonas sp. Nm34]